MFQNYLHKKESCNGPHLGKNIEAELRQDLNTKMIIH